MKTNQKGKWTLEEIKKGLDEYFTKYHAYPTTNDFDKVNFLPSSRLIQRNFGGIVELKKLLKINDTKDCSRGTYRSNIAKIVYNESVKSEYDFYKFLISLIPEVNVHEHKILRSGHICCDFFVYTSDDTGFAIDIFYAKDIFSLCGVINIKNKRYGGLNFPIYFVLVGNNLIDQKDIDAMIKNKKNILHDNIHVMNDKTFKVFIKNKYNCPTGKIMK